MAGRILEKHLYGNPAVRRASAGRGATRALPPPGSGLWASGGRRHRGQEGPACPPATPNRASAPQRQGPRPTGTPGAGPAPDGDAPEVTRRRRKRKCLGGGGRGKSRRRPYLPFNCSNRRGPRAGEAAAEWAWRGEAGGRAGGACGGGGGRAGAGPPGLWGPGLPESRLRLGFGLLGPGPGCRRAGPPRGRGFPGRTGVAGLGVFRECFPPRVSPVPRFRAKSVSTAASRGELVE